jgi:N-acetylglucosamine malate deacetylase 1
MLQSVTKVLVLAPHTDDAEIGCGGTIAKLLESGKEVYWAVFTQAAMPDTFPAGTVLEELKNSAKKIGVKPENLTIFDFTLRHFPAQRQEILEKMLELKKTIQPDLVFMPTLNDIHQDHATISQEGLRAFKHVSILGYEDPWNHLTFNTSSFVHLEKRHIDKKVEAIGEYKSQQHRPYTASKFIESLAYTRGIQIGVEYAEAFDVIRWIIN